MHLHDRAGTLASVLIKMSIFLISLWIVMYVSNKAYIYFFDDGVTYLSCFTGKRPQKTDLFRSVLLHVYTEFQIYVRFSLDETWTKVVHHGKNG